MYANILIGLDMIKVANRIKKLASFNKNMPVWRFFKFNYYFSFLLIRSLTQLHLLFEKAAWWIDLKVSLDFFLT